MSEGKRTGLDDGPPLPKHVIDGWRDPLLAKMRDDGASLREIADAYAMSHEGVRARLHKMGKV